MVSNGISASDRSMPSDVGCWVNSTVTRVVQTGIEHSRIPDAGYYMGSGMFSSLVTSTLAEPNKSENFSHLQTTNRPHIYSEERVPLGSF